MGILSKLFKRKVKLLEEADLSVLQTDMHSHLIPGIDDGSKDMGMTIALIEHLVHHGYTKIITTPHVMSDFYKNSSDTIRRGADDVREALSKAGINIAFEAAAEYYLDEYFEQLIEEKDILTFGDNYVLFELAFMDPPSSVSRAIFNLQMAGYKPILAHPERYPYWHGSFEKYEELVDRDVRLQLNINSLTGAYSPQVQGIAEKLIDNELITFLGTDCHHGAHLEMLHTARQMPHLHKILQSGKLMNSRL